MKLMEIEIKHYQLENILIKLNHMEKWKTQLTIAVNFISSKNTDEESVMHSKSDTIQIMIN